MRWQLGGLGLLHLSYSYTGAHLLAALRTAMVRESDKSGTSYRKSKRSRDWAKWSRALAKLGWITGSLGSSHFGRQRLGTSDLAIVLFHISTIPLRYLFGP